MVLYLTRTLDYFPAQAALCQAVESDRYTNLAVTIRIVVSRAGDAGGRTGRQE